MPEKAQDGVSRWPTNELVACGTPQNSIVAPLFLRRLPEPDGYVRSAFGFHKAGRIDVEQVVGYLHSPSWHWELRPVEDCPELPWETASRFDGESKQEEGTEKAPLTDGGEDTGVMYCERCGKEIEKGYPIDNGPFVGDCCLKPWDEVLDLP